MVSGTVEVEDVVATRLFNIPTEVKLDEVTPEASVEPVNVPAAAVIVPVDPNEIDVPLIVIELFVRAIVGVAPSPELLETVIPVPATKAAT
jgi:hypothetical protein